MTHSEWDNINPDTNRYVDIDDDTSDLTSVSSQFSSPFDYSNAIDDDTSDLSSVSSQFSTPFDYSDDKEEDTKPPTDTSEQQTWPNTHPKLLPLICTKWMDRIDADLSPFLTRT